MIEQNLKMGGIQDKEYDTPKKLQIAIFSLMAFVVISLPTHAELVIFSCPEPKDIIFILRNNHYYGYALQYPISGSWMPIMMEGIAVSSHVNQFTQATHSSREDGYLSCTYSMEEPNQFVTLVNRPIFGLKYCHFHKVGPKPDIDSCQSANVSFCEIECDTNA